MIKTKENSMPRGVPKAGFRAARSSSPAKAFDVVQLKPATQTETDMQIWSRIADRFDVLSTFTEACAMGSCRSMIVSGPAGLGKSHTVEETLLRLDPTGDNHTFVKGFVRATGLYKLLFQHSSPGQVLVLDDADSVFFDDVSLNLLKAVCDTTGVRRVGWRAEGSLIDDDTGERMPRSFDFKGTVVFITNLDFDALIDRGHKLAPHLQALVSRSHYIDLAMKTKRDYMVRIRQVVEAGLLSGLTPLEKADVMSFIETEQNTLRELSLRMVIKVADVRKMGAANFRKVAKVTCCKNG